MRLGYLEDSNGDRSLGRLISLIATIESVALSAIGSGLAIYETIAKPDRSVGVSIIALAVGIFSSGALLKGWQKASEVKEP